MESMSKKYVRVTSGYADKGQLVPLEDVDKHIKSDKDYYISTYHYSENDLLKFKENNNSVKGITNLKTNKLWFDFDDKNDLSLAQKDAQTVVRRLIKEGFPEDTIDIYFSGKKGFGVEVVLDRDLNRNQVEYLTIKKFGLGLKTLDVTLYDYSQIVRAPGTKHPDSGLFKTQLTINQLNKLDIKFIKEFSKDFKRTKTKSVAEDIPDSLLEVPIELKKENKVTSSVMRLDQILKDKPKGWKDYKWAMLHGYKLQAGERNRSMMVIASTILSFNYDKDIAESFLTKFDNNYALVTNQDKSPSHIQNVLDSVYSDGWIKRLEPYEQQIWVKSYIDRIGLSEKDKTDVISIGELEKGFEHFVQNIDKNTILTGIPCLDKAVPITTGMNLGILGSASSGKTAIALEILRNTSNAGVVSVFASLDMHRNRLFEKLLYKETNMYRDDLYSEIKKDGIGNISKKVKANYKNVYFYDRSSPTVDSIKQYVLDVEEKTGQKVKLVMLDYFERVNSDKGEDTAASKDISGKLQDMLNDLDIALVTLVQPNKFSLSQGPDAPLLSYTSIKGSSYLYQSFRSIISIWRPFFTPEHKRNDKFLQMAVLKNDLGELDLFNFSWEGRTGSIKELTEEQEEDFKKLLETKKKAPSGFGK